MKNNLIRLSAAVIGATALVLTFQNCSGLTAFNRTPVTQSADNGATSPVVSNTPSTTDLAVVNVCHLAAAPHIVVGDYFVLQINPDQRADALQNILPPDGQIIISGSNPDGSAIDIKESIIATSNIFAQETSQGLYIKKFDDSSDLGVHTYNVKVLNKDGSVFCDKTDDIKVSFDMYYTPNFAIQNNNCLETDSSYNNIVGTSTKLCSGKRIFGIVMANPADSGLATSEAVIAQGMAGARQSACASGKMMFINVYAPGTDEPTLPNSVNDSENQDPMVSLNRIEYECM